MPSAKRTGTADVVHPVGGVGELAGFGESACHVGYDRKSGFVPGELGEGGGEVGQHGFHQGRVEGVGDRQLLDLAALFTQFLGYCEDGVLVAGEDE